MMSASVLNTESQVVEKDVTTSLEDDSCSVASCDTTKKTDSTCSIEKVNDDSLMQECERSTSTNDTEVSDEHISSQSSCNLLLKASAIPEPVNHQGNSDSCVMTDYGCNTKSKSDLLTNGADVQSCEYARNTLADIQPSSPSHCVNHENNDFQRSTETEGSLSADNEVLTKVLSCDEMSAAKDMQDQNLESKECKKDGISCVQSPAVVTEEQQLVHDNTKDSDHGTCDPHHNMKADSELCNKADVLHEKLIRNDNENATSKEHTNYVDKVIESITSVVEEMRQADNDEQKPTDSSNSSELSDGQCSTLEEPDKQTCPELSKTVLTEMNVTHDSKLNNDDALAEQVKAKTIIAEDDINSDAPGSSNALSKDSVTDQLAGDISCVEMRRCHTAYVDMTLYNFCLKPTAKSINDSKLQKSYLQNKLHINLGLLAGTLDNVASDEQKPETGASANVPDEVKERIKPVESKLKASTKRDDQSWDWTAVTGGHHDDSISDLRRRTRSRTRPKEPEEVSVIPKKVPKKVVEITTAMKIDEQMGFQHGPKEPNRNWHVCLYCKKLANDISRHYATKHTSEDDVQEVLSFPSGSLERVELWKKLRKKGNVQYLKDNPNNAADESEKPAIFLQKTSDSVAVNEPDDVHADKVKPAVVPCKKPRSPSVKKCATAPLVECRTITPEEKYMVLGRFDSNIMNRKIPKKGEILAILEDMGISGLDWRKVKDLVYSRIQGFHRQKKPRATISDAMAREGGNKAAVKPHRPRKQNQPASSQNMTRAAPSPSVPAQHAAHPLYKGALLDSDSNDTVVSQTTSTQDNASHVKISHVTPTGYTKALLDYDSDESENSPVKNSIAVNSTVPTMSAFTSSSGDQVSAYASTAASNMNQHHQNIVNSTTAKTAAGHGYNLAMSCQGNAYHEQNVPGQLHEEPAGYTAHNKDGAQYNAGQIKSEPLFNGGQLKSESSYQTDQQSNREQCQTATHSSSIAQGPTGQIGTGLHSTTGYPTGSLPSPTGMYGGTLRSPTDQAGQGLHSPTRGIAPSGPNFAGHNKNVAQYYTGGGYGVPPAVQPLGSPGMHASGSGAQSGSAMHGFPPFVPPGYGSSLYGSAGGSGPQNIPYTYTHMWPNL